MSERNDDLSINGRPAPGDELLDPRGVPPPDSPGVSPPLPTPVDETVTTPRIPTTPPSAQAPTTPPGRTPSASELIQEDIAQTSGMGPSITASNATGTPTAKGEGTGSHGLPDQLRDRAMDKAHEITSSMGTTAGQLLGQAMELGSVAEQGARALGDLVQRQASDIVRQAQERFGMLESHPTETGEAVSGGANESASSGPSAPAKITENARATARRIGRKVPFEVNPVALAALGAALAVAIGSAIYLLIRRRAATQQHPNEATSEVSAANTRANWARWNSSNRANPRGRPSSTQLSDGEMFYLLPSEQYGTSGPPDQDAPYEVWELRELR